MFESTLLEGLSASEIDVVRSCQNLRHLRRGQLLFQEGDPAFGLYTILKGQVEVYRGNGSNKTRLQLMGPQEVFGEVGLVQESGLRGASIRALEDTELFELPVDPIELLERISNPSTVIRFLRNLVRILGQRLNSQLDGTGRGAPATIAPRADISGSLQVFEANMPGGFWRRARIASAGQSLWNAGDTASSFAFLYSGSWEALRNGACIYRLTAPAVAGVTEFFSVREHFETLRAAEPGRYSLFRESDFKRLAGSRPDAAMMMVYAAARLTAHQLITLTKKDLPKDKQ